MQEFDITQKVIILTMPDLYQLGWNGNNLNLDSTVRSVIPTDFEIDKMKFINKNLRIDLVRYDLVHEFTIDNGITEVPCPICDGYGKYEVYTSHSFDQDCENCNGTGKKHISEVC